LNELVQRLTVLFILHDLFVAHRFANEVLI
jgi:hypothetical protein